MREKDHDSLDMNGEGTIHLAVSFLNCGGLQALVLPFVTTYVFQIKNDWDFRCRDRNCETSIVSLL
jgi:hypothetical protein